MNEAKLIISDSERDSNMFYAAGILVPDDFIYLEKNGLKTIYVDSLEFNRAKKESKADNIVNYLKYTKKADKSRLAGVLIEILKRNKIKKVLVPENFKMKYAEILLANKIVIEIKNPFFKERALKNKIEIVKIKETQEANDVAMKKAISVIRKSKIRKDKKLSYENKILTSEFIKEIINIEFLKKGCVAETSIVSSGQGTSNPHQLGSGPIMANQPIIIDIWPRSGTARYFADMTRTVVKGKATPEIKKMYQAVLKAQEIGVSLIRPGARCSDIHRAVEDFFTNQGFKTEKQGKKIRGFIHGTGHGVGLDIHELPYLSANSKGILEKGNIVTVEPGLYYPNIGGVRIEDLVAVTKNGCENLTKFPKFLEIK